MRAVVFGPTGVAGDGVLRVCLEDARVSEVRAITRRPLPIEDAKLRSFDCQDFETLEGARKALDGVDVVFYCLGRAVALVGGEEAYRKLTFDFTMAAARELAQRSPQATFHFLSGQGTNPKSRLMWARVKGEAELALREVVDGLVCWRPGMILADTPPANLPTSYRMAYPVVRALYFLKPLSVTARHLGQAMLQATLESRREGVMENREIRSLAERYRASA